jgi:hypothetical protein
MSIKFNLKTFFLAVSVIAVAMLGMNVNIASAAITSGTITAVGNSDLYAGASNAKYDVVFDTDTTNAASNITITLPAGYSVPDGALGAPATIIQDNVGTAGTITIGITNGVSVSSVVGNHGANTVTVNLTVSNDLSVGDGVKFRLLAGTTTGIVNPTLSGATGTFTFDSNADTETEKSNVAAVTITPNVLSYFVVTGTASVAVNTANELTVTAKDAYNNTCSTGDNNYTGAGKLLTFSGPGLAPNTTPPTIETQPVGTVNQSITFTNGVSNAGALTLLAFKAETTTVNVVDNNAITSSAGHGLALTVTPGAGASLAFTQEPSSTALSGIVLAQQPIVTALDAYGNVDTNFVETITLTKGVAAGTLSNATEAAVAGVANFATGTGVSYSNSVDGETFQLTADDQVGAPDLASVLSATVVASDILATKFVWTVEPAVCVSGAVCGTQGTIQAQNAESKKDTNYIGHALISITQGLGGLVGTADQGAMTAGEITTAGIGYTAASDHELARFTVSNGGGLIADETADTNVNVAYTHLLVNTQPSAIVSGVSMVNPIIYFAGPSDVLDTDAVVNVTVSENGAGDIFSGTNPKASVGGIATFDDLVYRALTDHEIVTFTFTEAGNSYTVASNPITTQVVAIALDWTTEPSGCVSGFACTAQGVIKAKNAQGLVDIDWVTSVVITENEAGDLVGTGNQGAMIAGEKTTVGIGYAATADHQAFTLTAASGAIVTDTTAGITSTVVATKFLVTVNTVTPVAGVADTLTLTAANAQDITDLDYDPTAKVYTFVDSGASAISTHTAPIGTAPIIPDDATIIAAFGADGVAPLPTFTLYKAETLGTVTASDGTLSGTSASVTVSPAAMSKFTVVPSDTTPTTAETINVTVTAVDQYENIRPTYTGTVYLTANGGNPIWNNQIPSIVSGGTVLVSPSVRFNSAATVAITASLITDASKTGTSANITVTAATGALAVNSTTINPAKSYATNNNTFASGWEWYVNLTVPTDEPQIRLKFSDFTGATGSIPATGDNIRYYSAQSINAHTTEGTAVAVATVNTYPADYLIFNAGSDQDLSTPGIQATIKVQVKVPVAATGGSYAGQFMVASTPLP